MIEFQKFATAALDESTRTKVRIHQWAVLFKVDRRDTYVTKFVIRSHVSRSGGPGITSFSCGRTGIPNSAILITASVRGHAVLDKIQKQTPDGKDGTTCRALSTPLGPGCVVRSTVNNPFRRFGKNEPHKALQKCPKPTLVDRSGRSSRLFVNRLKFVAQGPARLVEPLRAVELIHLTAYSVPRAVC